MGKILFSIFLTAVFILTTAESSFASSTEYYDINPETGGHLVKQCNCEKYLNEHLELTSEQLKLIKARRAEIKKELKLINSKIKTNNRMIKDVQKSSLSDTFKEREISDIKEHNDKLNRKSEVINTEYNRAYEQYLTDEQCKTLEYMQKMKLQGKSCCPCGNNIYY